MCVGCAFLGAIATRGGAGFARLSAHAMYPSQSPCRMALAGASRIGTRDVCTGWYSVMSYSLLAIELHSTTSSTRVDIACSSSGQQDGGGQGAVGARGPATLGEKTRSAVDASGIRGQVGVARRGPTRWTHAVARGASGVLAWWEAITGEGGEVITGGWGLRKGNAKPSSGRGC